MLRISQFVDSNLNKNQQELKYMTQRLHNCLPFQLIPHVQIATQKKGSVTISTPNQSIAQKLRYCTRDIKKSLDVQHVHIVISNAKMPAFSSVPKTRRTIGVAGQRSLTETANAIPHEGIQNVLRKLSKQCSKQ